MTDSRPPVFDGLSRCAGSLAAILVGLALSASFCAAAEGPKSKGKYGAIALNRDTRALGYSYDLNSLRDAKREALKQCGDGKCEVLVSFRNACGAVADDRKKLWPATGATRAEAETRALRKCGKDCQLLAWACTR